MKILQIAGSGTIGTDKMGPISDDLFNLACQFHKFGHHVTIADAQSVSSRVLLNPGVRMVEIPVRPRWKAGASHPAKKSFLIQIMQKLTAITKEWLNEYHFIRQLLSTLEINQFDIIHVHERRPAFILQRIFHINCVYTSHTPSWINPHALDQHKGLRQMLARSSKYVQQKKLESGIIRRSQLTIGLGDYLKEAIPDARIITIPNGNDMDRFLPGDKNISRQKLGFAPNDFILVFVGRITPIKGVDVLLKAVELLMPQTENLQVIVIGSLSGSFNRTKANIYAQSLLDQSKNLPVKFTGFINNRSEEFRYHLSMADLFIFPSIFEPQGCVVLEALSMGIPVVASRTGGIPQMVNATVGRLFDPGNHVQLSKIIEYYYSHPQLLQSMAQNCRSHVMTHFTWERCAAKHLKAFESIIDH